MFRRKESTCVYLTYMSMNNGYFGDKSTTQQTICYKFIKFDSCTSCPLYSGGHTLCYAKLIQNILIDYRNRRYANE